MKNAGAIVLVGVVMIAMGYGAYTWFVSQQSDASRVNLEQPSLEKETKEMILFMHPYATEESAEAYLKDINRLNQQYGYKPGGTPKGDIETMRSYAAAVEELQIKHKIVSQDVVTTEPRTNTQSTPSLAPKGVNTGYIPPAGPVGTGGTPAATPPLIRNGNVPSAPAAPIMPTPETGFTASAPPLVEQVSIPPAPPLPPHMQE